MTRHKIKVGVLMGGPSGEHEVSLNTGANVLKYIDRKRFEPVPLILGRDWTLRTGNKRIPFPQGLARFNLVFIALHGFFGEDGTLQRMLEHLGVPYTGSSSVASFFAMDKWLAHQVFMDSRIPTPKTVLLRDASFKRKPLIIKPRLGGSSIGISIAKSHKDWNRATAKISADDHIVQEYKPGREFTCGVIEIGGVLKALPVVEIKPKKKHEFFNYEAKYTANESEEIVPARISKTLAKDIQRLVVRTHKALGCRIYSRTDIMVSGGAPYVIELNSLPGLTSNSLLPKEAAAIGISFPRLLSIICDASLRRNP